MYYILPLTHNVSLASNLACETLHWSSDLVDFTVMLASDSAPQKKQPGYTPEAHDAWKFGMRIVRHHWRDHKNSDRATIGIQFGRNVMPGLVDNHGPVKFLKSESILDFESHRSHRLSFGTCYFNLLTQNTQISVQLETMSSGLAQQFRTRTLLDQYLVPIGFPVPCVPFRRSDERVDAKSS
jgi:hypothetical protein